MYVGIYAVKDDIHCVRIYPRKFSKLLPKGIFSFKQASVAVHGMLYVFLILGPPL